MEILLVIILFVIIVFYFMGTNKDKNRTLARHHYSPSKQNNFIPIKIIENDNALNTIVSDFDERKIIATKELENNLGKALPNDVIWSVLQTLYLEYFLKDHKIILNVDYQRGLLLQKEKKYKGAISIYSYGLYYLMNFYKADLNPTAHIIDYVENDTQLIEMAQQKFINKIQRCMKYENINDLKVAELSYELISKTPLPNVSMDDYLLKTKPYFIQKKKDNSTQENLGSMVDLVSTHDDITDGLIFEATLQLRTPLDILKHHKEHGKRPPNYTKEAWQGIWMPKTKTYKDMGLPFDEIKSSVSSDIGSLEDNEAKLYLDFLIKFHEISESDFSVEDKIVKIKSLCNTDTDFNTYFIRHAEDDKEFLESYFGLLIKNILSNKVTTILNSAGYRTLKDLKCVDSKDLLKLKGIGKSTIDKLSEYLT